MRQVRVVATALTMVVSGSAAAQGPQPYYVRMLGSNERGQGFLVRAQGECQVLIPAHLVEGDSQIEMWGDGGAKYVGELRFKDERNDVALLAPTPQIRDCDPIDSGPDVTNAINSPSLFFLTRSQTGDITRTEVKPTSSNDRSFSLSTRNTGDRIVRGMSGSALVQNGKVIGLLVEATGDQKRDVTVIAWRSDFLARLLGNRLGTGNGTLLADNNVANARPAVDNAVTGSDAGSADQPISGAVDQPAGVAPSKVSFALTWPLRGKLLSRFGLSKDGVADQGIGIAAAERSNVKSAADGVVIYAATGVAGLGNLVMIKHGDGWTTIYGYLDKILVQRGQAVKKGQTIALSGATGFAETPRLHFEVRKGREPVDPLTVLPVIGRADE